MTEETQNPYMPPVSIPADLATKPQPDKDPWALRVLHAMLAALALVCAYLLLNNFPKHNMGSIGGLFAYAAFNCASNAILGRSYVLKWMWCALSK